MVNWTETMAKGLAMRKSYAKGARLGASFNKKKENIKEESRREKREDIAMEQAQANVDMTLSATEEAVKSGEAKRDRLEALSKELDPKPMTEMEKANLYGKKLQNMATGLKNATGFLPQVTKDTYSDWHKWVDETDFVPSTLFKSPDEVEKMNDVEFKVYKSKITMAGGLDTKSLDRLYKEKNAEKIAKAKVDAAEKVATARESTNKKRTAESFIKNSLDRYGEPDNMPPRIKESYERAVSIIEETLGTDYKEPNNAPQSAQVADMLAQKAMTEGAMSEGGQIDPNVLAQYKEMYPDKTDEEIINAYNQQR